LTSKRTHNKRLPPAAQVVEIDAVRWLITRRRVAVSTVCAEIRQSVSRLLECQGFQLWLENEKPEPGDHIVINNSFVFRDVKTVKSRRYLCLLVGDNGSVTPEPQIASGVRLNSDFKRSSVRSQHLPRVIGLGQAVSEEMLNVGQILFLLIGQVQDHATLTEPIDHVAFESILWDPSLTVPIHVSEQHIAVREIHDEESIWHAVEEHFRSKGQELPSGLREAIGVTLDKLQDQAVAEVEIPPSGTRPGNGITDAIVQILREQRDHYADALARYTSSQDPSTLNEILRIAYNFASDGTQYIRLIVSICDLKPLVLWGTIAEHYALSEAFRYLPWTRSRNKPSLKNYEHSISDARNSAFHNLFPFRMTLKVPLPDTALRAAELRIFSEYRHRKENQLTYQDKELVDVLTQFTRAQEQRVSNHFWDQNLKVMEATIALFARTSEFLKVLHAEIGTCSEAG